jgi:hypothetical protein
MLKSKGLALYIIAAVLATGAVATAQIGYFSSPVGMPMLGGARTMAPLGGNWMQPPPVYYEPAYQVSQPAVLPQTSASIEAEVEKDGRVLLKWQGEPGAVDRIVFSLLDANKKAIMDQKIERLPAEARFPLTNKSAYYRVTVYYLNGATTTVTSLL